ncbi:AAA family ATPase [Clostridium sp. D2Q-14]|uniref:AAA family ATPase n=1 Tax=Anaeromonas gelatinilytica TaxID=2683194 RepID=UPI00193C3CB3|nr:ATP-binding protein [Anaeromonas gelatinilytica]MBS4536783.1 AAA family ATPase [Anaeromonas gelatinilytica]
MIVTGYKINNYKSIGNENNYLFLDPNITALIGKNESGKSNILEAVAKLSFNKPLDSIYLANKNRGSNEEISVLVDMEFYKYELSKYNISQEKSRISFLDSSTINIEGGFAKLIKNDSLLTSLINKLIESKNNRKLWGNDTNRLKHISNYCNELVNISSQIFTNHNMKLNNLKKWIIKDYDNKEYVIKTIDNIISTLEHYYNLLPRIYYREKDRQLSARYKYDEIKNIINEPDHIFNRFLSVAKISESEIIGAFEASSLGEKKTIRNKIGEKIKENIEEQFNKFYKQEKILFEIDYDNMIFTICFSTGDKITDLSERSNGLRWYLSLFLDIRSHDYKNFPILFLLDEPGVHLHVNAQKKLLDLFKDLANNNNQILYTTHSPYMINNRDITNIRAIEKDSDGNTKIYKNAYNQRLSNDSKMETLSPLVNAIGSDLKFNIGPSSKCNIITEGISDYMYINAMLDYLEINDKPNIIPSAGVNNINRIVSILIGWGCDFKILLDYDKQGEAEYNVLVNKLDEELISKIYFVNCKTEPNEKEMKSFPKTIESLISENDYNNLAIPYDGTSETKMLSAKEFCSKLKMKEIDVEDNTISKFKNLFYKLGID